MITLIKPGYYRILQIFYRNKSLRLHLREISRQAHLHIPSASRFLKELERAMILKSEKDGNQKKYFLNHNSQTDLVFEMFDLEKLEKLPLLRKKAIRCYLQNLSPQPVFAVLFGSTAKETYREESDIDILLIGNKNIDSKKAEKEVFALTSFKISTFQIPYQNFIKELKLKQEPVIQSAINSGYPLINHLIYYEVLYDERI